MAKKIKEEEVKTPAEATPQVEKKEKSEKKTETEITFPEVAGNGKFQAVEVKNGEESGFAVYNPTGQRVSGLLGDAAAKDLVLRQNNAGHYK